MNMAQLIALKEQLSHKKYGAVRIDERIKKLPEFRTAEEIINQERTFLAKYNIEHSIEQIVEQLGNMGFNYDLININLEASYFIKEYAIRLYQDQETKDVRYLENKFNSNDILDDYISFTYEIDVFECMGNGDLNYISGSNLLTKMIKRFKPKEMFVVKYSDFIAMITELGYSVVISDTDIKSPSFEKIKSMIAARRSADLTIELDFRKKENVPTK